MSDLMELRTIMHGWSMHMILESSSSLYDSPWLCFHERWATIKCHIKRTVCQPMTLFSWKILRIWVTMNHHSKRTVCQPQITFARKTAKDLSRMSVAHSRLSKESTVHESGRVHAPCYCCHGSFSHECRTLTPQQRIYCSWNPDVFMLLVIVAIARHRECFRM